MTRVLVLAEHRKGELREVSLECLSAASGLPDSETSGAVCGEAHAAIANEFARFAPRVVHLAHPGLDTYSPVEYASALAELVTQEGFEAVVLPHSYHGMDLAGRLAIRLDRPFVTDATGLSSGEAGLTVHRQVYGGRVESKVSLPAGAPFLLSVRPTAFPKAEPRSEAGTVETFTPTGMPEATAVRFMEYLEEAAGDVDITQADILVAVGRGIGEEENLEVAQELADALGGVLACSRPIVDRGWLPRDRQVGTSGKSVRPKVYVALGISGAFQHVAGMAGAGRVIAINRDPNAPIFKVADYGIVGDIFQVAPALIAAARARRG